MATVARKSSGIVVPHPLPWHGKLLAWFIYFLAWAVMKSWRCRWPSADNRRVEGPVIFCIWHNRLALAVKSWDGFAQAKWPAEGVAAMISASRDGGLLAAVVEKFGVETIRGSTSRRGPQALLEATTWLEKNHNIAITPDGPRGPCYHIQEGIIQLAAITGRPIIPVSNFVHRKIRARSWDGFQIPLPFTRCELRFGEPIYVAREASEAEREEARQRLEQAMLAITRD